VLLVDTAVVTGNAIYASAVRLRAAGVQWIGAAVYHRLRPDLDELNETGIVDALCELTRR
jgi:hypothetical protein